MVGIRPYMVGIRPLNGRNPSTYLVGIRPYMVGIRPLNGRNPSIYVGCMPYTV